MPACVHWTGWGRPDGWESSVSQGVCEGVFGRDQLASVSGKVPSQGDYSTEKQKSVGVSHSHTQCSGTHSRTFGESLFSENTLLAPSIELEFKAVPMSKCSEPE